MFEHIQHPQQRAFLAAFSECGIVKRAAKIAGISREVHYDWKAKDADYAQAFAWATELAGDALEDEAIRRGQLGVKDYVLYQGEIVQVNGKPLKRIRYSDALLAKTLEAHKRQKYGKVIEHTGEVKHVHEVDLSGLDESELDALERILGKARPAHHAGSDSGGTREAPEE